MLTPRKTLAERFTQGHEQRRRNTFAGDVAHEKEKVISVEHKSIVQIAPYFERRLQHRMEFQVSGQPLDGSGSRQHSHLNLTRRLEFASHTGAFDSFRRQCSV